MQSTTPRRTGERQPGTGGRATAREPQQQPGRAAVSAVKEQAAEAVAEATRRARDAGREALDKHKHRAAGELDSLGASVRATAEQLRAGPLAAAGDYVESAAEGLERASRYLEEQDLAALRRDAEELVRGRPGWFLGGMFVAGLALARFAKAGAAGSPDRPPGKGSSPRGRNGARDRTEARPRSERRGANGPPE